VNGLPDGFDSSVFVGRRVDHVTFCEFTIFIGIDSSTPAAKDGITLSIFGLCVHEVPGEATEELVVDERAQRSGLMRLCGRTVIASDPSTLRLTMDDGQVLSAPVQGGPYESFSVAVGDQEFVI
jgi:hypothetical protein